MLELQCILELKNRNINMNLYLGNEVYICEGIPELLNKDISTINNSNYLLMELPLTRKSLITEEVLDELLDNDIIPIIAHPERYLAYYKYYDYFTKLKEYGCYFQSNIGSIYGEYGRKPKKMIKELLKRDLIDFIGSDIHSPHQELYSKEIKKDLLKIVKDEQKVENILTNNAKKVLSNQEI